jgi:hypothetical protein
MASKQQWAARLVLLVAAFTIVRFAWGNPQPFDVVIAGAIGFVGSEFAVAILKVRE